MAQQGPVKAHCGRFKACQGPGPCVGLGKAKGPAFSAGPVSGKKGPALKRGPELSGKGYVMRLAGSRMHGRTLDGFNRMGETLACVPSKAPAGNSSNASMRANSRETVST